MVRTEGMDPDGASTALGAWRLLGAGGAGGAEHTQENCMQDENTTSPPPHPFWCNYCGHHSAFSIKGCPIDHMDYCERKGENAETVYEAAVEYCRQTGKAIP